MSLDVSASDRTVIRHVRQKYQPEQLARSNRITRHHEIKSYLLEHHAKQEILAYMNKPCQ